MDDEGGGGKEWQVLPSAVVGAMLGLTLKRAPQLEAQPLEQVRVRSMGDNRG